MQDWCVAVGLIVVAIVGSDIHGLQQKTDENHATVTEIANRKSHITSRISSAETSAENIKMSLEE